MKLAANHHERVAGIFVAAAFGIMVAFTGWLVFKQGWFKSKVHYHTHVTNASGLRPGCPVEISGLKVGEVGSVKIEGHGRIDVSFWLFEEYREQVRQDSGILVLRPFVIGDKSLDLLPGNSASPLLPPGSLIASDELFSFMEILNGKKLAPYMKTLDGLASQLKDLAELFIAKKERSAPHPLLGRAVELVSNVDKLVRQLTQGGHLQAILKNTASLTGDTNMQQVTRDLSTLVGNLALFTTEFRKVTPAFAEIGPDLPRSARRALEALDETVVVLKAIQKSFLLRGSAEEVREEESRKKPGVNRAPAQGS